MRLYFLIVFFISGCAHFTNSVSNYSSAGDYSNHDEYCPRTLKLYDNGTFTYNQLTDIIQINKDGKSVLQGSWGMSGTWSMKNSDRIELLTEPQKDRFTILIRMLSSNRIVLLEPHLDSEILKSFNPSLQSTSKYLTK